jgi:predicted histidine transporter YuiF (NhaC family)
MKIITYILYLIGVVVVFGLISAIVRVYEKRGGYENEDDDSEQL